jgi:hypothetical protein
MGWPIETTNRWPLFLHQSSSFHRAARMASSCRIEPFPILGPGWGHSSALTLSKPNDAGVRFRGRPRDGEGLAPLRRRSAQRMQSVHRSSRGGRVHPGQCSPSEDLPLPERSGAELPALGGDVEVERDPQGGGQAPQGGQRGLVVAGCSRAMYGCRMPSCWASWLCESPPGWTRYSITLMAPRARIGRAPGRLGRQGPRGQRRPSSS